MASKHGGIMLSRVITGKSLPLIVERIRTYYKQLIYSDKLCDRRLANENIKINFRLYFYIMAEVVPGVIEPVKLEEKMKIIDMYSYRPKRP